MDGFRWRSWFGVSALFFLVFGGINLLLAIAVPIALHVNGAFPGVVFGNGDTQLLGRTFTDLRRDNPKLDTLLVDSMTSMCAMQMGWAITTVAAVWFGFRRGYSWAYWAILVSGLLSVMYYFVISADYARQGAQWADGLQSVLLVFVPLVFGAISGGVALVQRRLVRRRSGDLTVPPRSDGSRLAPGC